MTDFAVNRKSETDCPYQLFDPQVVFNGRWMQARQVWQSAHRNTRPEGASADGVSVIALLKRAGKKYIILVKQFRIPMGHFCLEFPAGLIDKGETAEEAATRELKEETGYTVSRILSKSAMCGLDPGLTDDSVNLILLEIDGDAPENVNPAQKLESTEAIDVILVEHDDLLNYLKSAKKEEVIVEACLYAYAMGVHFAKATHN